MASQGLAWADMQNVRLIQGKVLKWGPLITLNNARVAKVSFRKVRHGEAHIYGPIEKVHPFRVSTKMTTQKVKVG